MTPQDVARVYRVPVGYVRVLAHRHRWRRVRYAGRVYYRAADVDATLGRDGHDQDTPADRELTASSRVV